MNESAISEKIELQEAKLVKMEKECEALLEKLEQSYTNEQQILMSEVDSLLNSIYRSRKMLKHLYEKIDKKYTPNYQTGIKEVTVEKRRFAERMSEFRQKYPKVGQKWKDEDDEKLREEYKNGKGIPEISTMFQRSELAIRYRLHKLGLLPDFAPFQRQKRS